MQDAHVRVVHNSKTWGDPECHAGDLIALGGSSPASDHPPVMPRREAHGAREGRKAPPGPPLPFSGADGWALVMDDTAHTRVPWARPRRVKESQRQNPEACGMLSPVASSRDLGRGHRRATAHSASVSLSWGVEQAGEGGHPS